MGIKLDISVETPLSADDRDILAGISVMVLAIANRQTLKDQPHMQDEDEPPPCGAVNDEGHACVREVDHAGRHEYRRLNGLACLYRFDPATGQRSAARQGPDGHHHDMNGDSAWLLSGEHLLLAIRREVDLYDVASGASWYVDSVVTRYRRNATATALADGRVLIAGGTDVTSDEGPGFVTGAAEIAGPA